MPFGNREFKELSEEEQFDLLCEAARANRIGMEHRDFAKAADMVTQALGRDLYIELQRAEFASLSEETKAQEKNNGQRGRFHFSAYYGCTHPAVSLALLLVAKEACPEKDPFNAAEHEKLARPEMRDYIATRFPVLTKARIQKILSL